MTRSMTDRIRTYWENPKTISLIDENLRMLETRFVLSCLRRSDNLLDIGCGDGRSTVRYAGKVTACTAFEPSSFLRDRAHTLFRREKSRNICLAGGDVLRLESMSNSFDAVVTQRVLINLPTWRQQQKALTQIWSVLKSGGRYVMIENTVEGFQDLNRVRRRLGLRPIPLHWHNLFFKRDALMKALDPLYEVVRVETFNLYYLLTRVFLNLFLTFEGYGSAAKKDNAFKKADEAARVLHELLGDRLKMEGLQGDSFGPIQGFLLRKKR